jgi:carboxyl-terminal processing protease
MVQKLAHSLRPSRFRSNPIKSGLRLLCLLLVTAAISRATLTPQQRQKNLDSFEFVWSTIRNKHWDNSLDGEKWKAAHDELLPKMQKADSLSEARSVLREMISRLNLTHYNIIPGDVYSDINDAKAASVHVRVIDGKPVAVSGKYAGYEIKGMDEVVQRVDQEYKDSTLRDLMLARAVEKKLADKPAQLAGDGSGIVTTTFDDSPRGEKVQFGLLPAQYFWIESKTIGDAGYVNFNVFLNPPKLFGVMDEALANCTACRGFIIDIRGNSGGIGGMAMGLSGYFVSKPNQQLGTMYTRGVPLKFFINPRAPHFEGKLAILVDGLSASTSEIFAGGLQDLHRARIFGTHTAGAALPSVIEKLPNGDGFQYAIANYISEGGKTLEGNGVTPDVEIAPDPNALRQGRDVVLEAALQWIQK